MASPETPNKEEDTTQGVIQTDNEKQLTRKERSKLPHNILRRAIHQCCRTNDLSQALELLEKHDGKVSQETIVHVLGLCNGLQDRSVHIGSSAVHDDILPNREWSFRVFTAQRILQQYTPVYNLAVYAALIGIYSQDTSTWDQAHEYLERAEAQFSVKLRMYAGLWKSYCTHRASLERILQLWKRIVVDQELDLTEREYLALLPLADAPVFARILQHLVDEFPIPARDTHAALVEWFRNPNTSTASQAGVDALTVRYKLPAIGPVTGNFVIHEHVSVDSEGNLQGNMNCRLQPVLFDEWEELAIMNETIVLKGQLEQHQSPYQGGNKGHKRHKPHHNVQQVWKDFKHYVNTLKDIQVVIDGANVGYFAVKLIRKVASTPVEFGQIDSVLRQFPPGQALIVLHSRHLNRVPSPEAQSMVDAWKREGCLYASPHGMNDDWFWMHIALQTKALVVTNDEMRDHHFQMLGQRQFSRWKDRRQVRFDFADATKTKMKLFFPDIYSRRMQQLGNVLVIPNAKRGDTNRYLDGCVVARDDYPEEETYTCIVRQPEE